MKTIQIILILTGLIAFSANSPAEARGTKELTPDVQARLIALEALRGSPVGRDTFNGKPVLVTFFASWCPPCAIEMRDLKSFIDREGPDQINIIAVNWIEELTGLNPNRLRRFMRLIDPSIKVVAGTGEVSRDFGTVFSIPAAFIYDGDGKQVFSLGDSRGGHGRHYLSRRELERVLKNLKK